MTFAGSMRRFMNTTISVLLGGGSQMLCYGKSTPDHSDNILVVVNLDPHETRSGQIWFDPAEFGFAAGETIKVTDLISGRNWEWSGGDQWVRLDPAVESAHIFHFQR